MSKHSPKIGNRYLTVTGVPVQILEVRDEAIVLQGLASDNRFYVPTVYPLQPFDQKKAAWEMRPSPYSSRSKKVTGRATQDKPLAPIIDAMLLAGSKTMRGIVREVKRKANGSCKGKDVFANVRARIYWFRKKGGRLERNDRDQLRVVLP